MISVIALDSVTQESCRHHHLVRGRGELAGDRGRCGMVVRGPFGFLRRTLTPNPGPARSLCLFPPHTDSNSHNRKTKGNSKRLILGTAAATSAIFVHHRRPEGTIDSHISWFSFPLLSSQINVLFYHTIRIAPGRSCGDSFSSVPAIFLLVAR